MSLLFLRIRFLALRPGAVVVARPLDVWLAIGGAIARLGIGYDRVLRAFRLRETALRLFSGNSHGWLTVGIAARWQTRAG